MGDCAFPPELASRQAQKGDELWRWKELPGSIRGHAHRSPRRSRRRTASVLKSRVRREGCAQRSVGSHTRFGSGGWGREVPANHNQAYLCLVLPTQFTTPAINLNGEHRQRFGVSGFSICINV